MHEGLLEKDGVNVKARPSPATGVGCPDNLHRWSGIWVQGLLASLIQGSNHGLQAAHQLGVVFSCEHLPVLKKVNDQ